MTFKELLNQCSWEDLEDFLYEFPDEGRGWGRQKMEGFRRMYDELRGDDAPSLGREDPAAKRRNRRLRVLCTVHPADSQSTVRQMARIPRAGGRPAQRDGTPSGSHRSSLHVRQVRTRIYRAGVSETYRRIAEPEVSHRLVARYNLDIEVYNTPSASIKRR